MSAFASRELAAEPEILCYTISLFCPTSGDGLRDQLT